MVKEIEYDSKKKLNRYCYPEHGITIEAKDLKEATKKLNKLLKDKNGKRT